MAADSYKLVICDAVSSNSFTSSGREANDCDVTARSLNWTNKQFISEARDLSLSTCLCSVAIVLLFPDTPVVPDVIVLDDAVSLSALFDCHETLKRSNNMHPTSVAGKSGRTY